VVTVVIALTRATLYLPQSRYIQTALEAALRCRKKALGGGRPSATESAENRPPGKHVHVVSNAPLGLHLRLQLHLFMRPCVPLTAADARSHWGTLPV
jgi:hypothetical protein